RDWSSDVCSSDLTTTTAAAGRTSSPRPRASRTGDRPPSRVTPSSSAAPPPRAGRPARRSRSRSAAATRCAATHPSGSPAAAAPSSRSRTASTSAGRCATCSTSAPPSSPTSAASGPATRRSAPTPAGAPPPASDSAAPSPPAAAPPTASTSPSPSDTTPSRAMSASSSPSASCSASSPAPTTPRCCARAGTASTASCSISRIEPGPGRGRGRGRGIRNLKLNLNSPFKTIRNPEFPPSRPSPHSDSRETGRERERERERSRERERNDARPHPQFTRSSPTRAAGWSGADSRVERRSGRDSPTHTRSSAFPDPRTRSAPAVTSAAMNTRPLRLSAAWLLRVTSPPIRGGALLVDEHGRIAAVGPDQAVPQPEDAERIDLGDAALLPGLVNVHAHPELAAFRGLLDDLPFHEWIPWLNRLKRDAALTAEDYDAAARWTCVEALSAGITTLAATEDSGAALDALRAAGMRGVAYREVFGPAPEQADDALAKLQRKVEDMRA